MAARSRKAAPKAQKQAEPAQETQAVQWLDTWRKGEAKVTLFAFVADSKLCVKVSEPALEPLYLNSEDLESYLDADAATIRGWMGDSTRFGTSVQAGLDSYLNTHGWKSSKAMQEAKAERLAGLGL